MLWIQIAVSRNAQFCTHMIRVLIMALLLIISLWHIHSLKVHQLNKYLELAMKFLELGTSYVSTTTGFLHAPLTHTVAYFPTVRSLPKMVCKGGSQWWGSRELELANSQLFPGVGRDGEKFRLFQLVWDEMIFLIPLQLSAKTSNSIGRQMENTFVKMLHPWLKTMFFHCLCV